MGVRNTTTLLGALAAVIALFAPPAANASSVRVTQGKVRYVGGGTEANRVEVAHGFDGAFTIIDPGARVRVGAGCTPTGRSSATCSGATAGVSISGGNGNDVLNVTFLEVPATLDGGSGNDVLIGGGANDLLDADAGNDRLIARGGADRLMGDDGSDSLNGGPGPDVIDGGTGTDTATYADATGPLAIDLDGNADDGESGEGDRVEADVDNVIGGPFDDRIAAVSGAHRFEGRSGNDLLAGGSGADRLDGGDGDDRLNGGVGSDVLIGAAGDDTVDYAGRFDHVELDLRAGLAITDRGSGTRRVRETDELHSFEHARGTSHADVLRGGPGPNTLVGGPGNDVLDGGPGGDVLDGGGGRDRADYSGRRAPVAVTLDDQPDDGAAGEGDLVTVATEDVTGGAGGDRLTGSARRNTLFGGGGRDVLTGLAAGDTLDGGDGADRVEGGDGADALTGGAGLDLLLGGADDDRVDARDRRRDGVECGGGSDTVFADRVDRIDGACERERR